MNADTPADQKWRQKASLAISSHRRKFDREITRIRKLVDASKLEEAAVFAQIAASFAWQSHTGQHTSEALEELVLEIGHKAFPTIGATKPKVAPSTDKPLNIMHVVTESYSVGGHTRMVWRWINNDSSNQHSIVLTGQSPHAPVPENLSNAAEITPESILSSHTPILERATHFRQIAATADLIVLHTHPYDVIPVIALASGEGYPPVIINNHADHAFWLGVKIANVVMNLREAGQAISERWRGIPPTHCTITPLPLPTVSRTKNRAEAKKALGLPQNTILLLSIASQYKYAYLAPELDFTTAPLPLLKANPSAYLYVIGVTEDKRWMLSRKQTNERFKTFSATPNIQTFFEAADIYLDSFPFGSLTSLLEAGQYATPVCTLACGDHLCAALRAEDPALKTVMHTASTLQEWQRSIQTLIHDPNQRSELGNKTQRSINDLHTESGWIKSLHQTYQKALKTPRIEQLAIQIEPFSTENLLVQAVQAEGKLEQSWSSIATRQLHLLPVSYRIKLAHHSLGLFVYGFKRLKPRAARVYKILASKL